MPTTQNACIITAGTSIESNLFHEKRMFFLSGILNLYWTNKKKLCHSNTHKIWIYNNFSERLGDKSFVSYETREIRRKIKKNLTTDAFSLKNIISHFTLHPKTNYKIEFHCVFTSDVHLHINHLKEASHKFMHCTSICIVIYK